MIDKLEYIFKKNRKVFDEFYTTPIDFSKDKYGNTITKDSELYNKSRQIKKIIKDFEEGQNLISKITTKYSLRNPDIWTIIDTIDNNKISSLESYFIKRGEDFTLGFLSNFKDETIPFHLPKSTHGNAGDLIEELSCLVDQFSFRLAEGITKLEYKKEYNSAKRALRSIEEIKC